MMMFSVTRTTTFYGYHGNANEPPCANAVWDIDKGKWFIKINTLEDLLNLISDVDEEVIIEREYIVSDSELIYTGGYSLEIYDDYKE